MSNSGQIFEWEGITQPSYWGGQATSEGGQAAMQQIANTGASTLTLIPNFFQANKFSNTMGLKLHPTNPWGSESDTFAQVKLAIQNAKALGLKVVLKPHLETENRVWRAELAPTDPIAWFENYKAMMVEYAKVAQEAGAEMFVIGTEMDSMIDPTKVCSDGMTYTEKWEDIIAAVRAVYSGKVTYAATYWTVKNVGFWDKLDYIGVDSYIPLSTVNDPTVEQMIDAWIKPHFNPWVRDLHEGKSVVEYYKSLSEQYGKQVIFTEVGYKSMDGANKDPGVFGGSGTVDYQEQVDAYTALFHVMEHYGGQWLAGSFMWSYYSFNDPVGEGWADPTDYTTQHKPANQTITHHYSGPAHGTGLVWNGTGGTDKLDGGYHNDTLNGAGGDDVLWGGKGHDLMKGGAGNDTIAGGGGGCDIAVFSGNRNDYDITRNADGSFTVTHKNGGADGTDLLRHVHAAQFADETFILDGPVDMTLTGSRAQELAQAGALIGVLGAEDGDGDGTFTYVFAHALPGSNGLVSADGRFRIAKVETDGNVSYHLQVNNGYLLDYEQARSHSVRIEVSDQDGIALLKSFTIATGNLDREVTYGSLANDIFKAGAKHDYLRGNAGYDKLYGGAGNDKLYGDAGNDRLYGEYGKDTLYGGSGKDIFVFNAKLGTSKTDRKVNFDTIKDFKVKDDTIWLDNKVFKKLGKKGSESKPAKLNKKFFTIGDKAKDKDDYLIYNKKTGVLMYDADGSGKGKAIEIAQTKNNLKMTYGDFFVM